MTAPPPFVVFINGPPGSGKDTLAQHLRAKLRGLQVVKFAGHLKRATHFAHCLFDVADDPGAFEASKDRPLPEFFGVPPRLAYIAFSERYMKPLHGKDVFGRILVREMDQLARRILGLTGFAISDSGFAEEAQPVIARFGAANCLLIRVHAEARGCTFEGDSRAYIELPNVVSHDLENNGAQHVFTMAGEAIVRQWLAETHHPAEGNPAQGSFDDLPGWMG